MKTEIFNLAPGVSNCYLIKGEHNILVDTGPPKKVKKILKKLADLSVVAQDISLIVLTHGHWDHVGSLFDLKETASCKVAVHQREKKMGRTISDTFTAFIE